MKLKFLMLIFSFLILTACGVTKPVATTHTERIETHLQPIPIGADTIIIESVFLAGEATASSVSSVSSVREKENSVRNKNSEGVKSVQICRAPSCAARERIEEKEELKSELSVQSVGDNSNPEGTRSINQRSLSQRRTNGHARREVKNSVHSVRDKNSSVRNKNSVRISSTRGVNISRYETDTTSMLRITLRPDTVFVPYTNHIRSDTIVVPDRICKMKLQKMQMANTLLILIIIVATIIFFVKDRMTR